MEFVIFGIGIAIGVLAVTFVSSLRQASGTLRIDRTDPTVDKYMFVIDDDLDKIPNKKKIVLKIDPNADFSKSSQK